jgi:hypothetical protein
MDGSGRTWAACLDARETRFHPKHELLFPARCIVGDAYPQSENPMSSRTFVVVGAGFAGATAAQTLREQGFEGRIVLFGDEGVVPYERPPLSKGYLRGETGFDAAAVHAAIYQRGRRKRPGHGAESAAFMGSLDCHRAWQAAFKSRPKLRSRRDAEFGKDVVEMRGHRAD